MPASYPTRKFLQLASENSQTITPGILSLEAYTAATTGSSVEIWVGPNGSDTNNGLSYNTRKKTLLAAYDTLPTTGGTIYIEDGTYVGGEIANQGIWLMSTVDANWGKAGYPGGTNPTQNGWRVLKNVKWQGIGGRTGTFVKEGVSIIYGGQPGQNWAADPNKPAIFISDGNGCPQYFSNLAIEGPYRVAVLGRNSDRSLVSNPFATLVTFDHCELAVSGSNASGVGPAIETGHCILCYIKDCFIASWGNDGIAYAPHSFTAEEAGACVLTKPQNGAVGGYSLKDCTFSRGNIIFEVGNSGWQLLVENLLVEGDWVHFVPPPVKLVDITIAGAAVIKNIAISDAGGYPIGVQITPAWANKTIVRTENALTVIGPHTAIDSLDLGYYGHTNDITPAAYGGVGLWNDRLVARHDGIARAGSPVIARYENLIASDNPTLGTGAVIASGIADPWGGSSARRLSVSGAYASATGSLITEYAHSYIVGDRIVIGSYIRYPLGTSRVLGSMQFATHTDNLFADAGGGATTASGGYYFQLSTDIDGSDQWQWLVDGHKLTTCGHPTGNFLVSMNVASGEQLDFAAPLVQVIPSGDMTDNEFSEYLLHLSSIPPAAKPGSLYSPTGINMVIDGALETSGDIFSNGNIYGTSLFPTGSGVLYRLQPSYDGASISPILVPSPCPSSHLELLEQGWDSMDSGGATDGEIWYCDEGSPGNLIGKKNGYQLAAWGSPLPSQNVPFFGTQPHAAKSSVQTSVAGQAFLCSTTDLAIGTSDFSVSMLLSGTTLLYKQLVCSWMSGKRGWGLTTSTPYVSMLLQDATGYSFHDSTFIIPTDDSVHLITVAIDRNGYIYYYIDKRKTETVLCTRPGTLTDPLNLHVSLMGNAYDSGGYTPFGKCAWFAMWVGKAISRRGHDNLARALRLS